MRRQKLFAKVLSGVLCVSMLFQNVSLPTYAKEAETVSITELSGETVQDEGETETEEAQAPEKETPETGEAPTEEVSGNDAGEERQADAENTGYFSTVRTGQISGYTIDFQKITYVPQNPDVYDTKVFLDEYDSKGKVIGSYRVNLYYYSNYGKYEIIGTSVGLLPDMSYAKIKAVDYDKNTGAEVSSVTYDQQFDRTTPAPDVVFTKKEQSAETSSLKVTLGKAGRAYSSAGFKVDFIGGTSEDSTTWTQISQCVVSVSDDSEEDIFASLNWLTPSTTYYGKLNIYIDGDSENKVYSTDILLDSFTTGDDREYTIKDIFPDDVLREKVVRELQNYAGSENISADGTVKKSQLDKITTLSANRTSFSQPAIRDLTGLELLSNLSTLYLENNEISDISCFHEMKELNDVYLKGNEISKAADISGARKLKTLRLDENLLSAEEYTKQFNLSAANPLERYENSAQRVNGYDLITEDNYYIVNGKTGLYVRPDGFKTGLDYTMKFFLNGAEKEFTNIYTGNFIYRYIAEELTEGSENTLTVEFYAGGTKVGSSSKTFTVVSNEIYSDAGVLSYNAGIQQITGVFMDTNPTSPVVSVALTDKGGNVYSTVGEWETYSTNVCYDARMTKVKDRARGGSGVYDATDGSAIHYSAASVSLTTLYAKTPAGDYDLTFTRKDGTVVILADAVHIREDNTFVITNTSRWTEGDSSKDYCYIELSGENIDPASLTYQLQDKAGNLYELTFDSYKRHEHGVIVKLAKNQKLQKKESYTILVSGEKALMDESQTNYVILDDEVYYMEFNPYTRKLELGVTYAEDGSEVSVELCESSNQNSASLGITGKGTLKNGLTEITLYNSNGTPCTKFNRANYVRIKYNGKVYMKTMYIYKEELLADSMESEEEKFLLYGMSASHVKDQVELYVDSNCADPENFKFTFTDAHGKKITGVKLEKAGYPFRFSGLSEYNVFSVYVEHAVKGKAYKYDNPDELYFSDSTGEQITVNQSNNSAICDDDERLVGVRMITRAYPVTVQIYRPYDTTELAKVTVNANDTTSDDRYYFTAAFVKSLPDADGRYNIVVTDADGRVYTNKGCFGSKNVKPDPSRWSVSIDKETIAVDETATLTYSGTAPVTVTSLDPNVLTVKKVDASTFTLIPVQVGEVIVQAKANGETRSYRITVTRQITMQGIAFTQKETSYVIEEDGQTVKLYARVTPIDCTVDTKEVTVTSSNEEVVAVRSVNSEGSRITMEIAALQTGSAEITVKVGEFSNTTTVTFVQDGYGMAVTEANQMNRLYAITNTADGKPFLLGNVKLPEYWSWVDDSVVLTADNSRKIQYYDAVFRKPGYTEQTCPLPVYVTKVSGVTIFGKDQLLRGDWGVYEVLLQYTGYSLELYEEKNLLKDMLDINFTQGKNLQVEGVIESQATVTAGQVSKDTKDSLKVNVVVNGKTKLSASKNILVLAEKTVQDMEVTLSAEQPDNSVKAKLAEDILTIEAEDIVAKTGDTVSLDAKAFIDNEAVPTSLVWKISDSKVAAIKADKTGSRALLTVKKAGLIKITVTAKDSGAYTKEITLNVKDYSPVVPETKITLNQYLLDGTTIPFYVQNGNGVKEAALYAQEKNGELSTVSGLTLSFEKAASGDGKEGILHLTTDQELTKNAVYKDLVLKLTTDNGKVYDYRLTVTVDTKKPAVKLIQQGKLNLFYKSSYVILNLQSEAPVDTLSDITAAADGQVTLREAYYEKGAYASYQVTGLTAENVNEFKKNGVNRVYKVTFEGYKASAAQEIKLKLATEMKAPQYALSEVKFAENMSLCANIVEAKTKKPVYENGLKGCTFTIVKPTEGLTAEFAGNTLNLTYSGTKSLNYEVQVTNAKWLQPLTLKGKLTAVKQAEVVTAQKEILLNTLLDNQSNDMTGCDVSLAGNDMDLSSIRFTAKNAAAAALINSGALTLTFDESSQKVYAGLNKGYADKVKPGSYAFIMKSTVASGSGTVSVKDAVLNIKIVDGNKVKPKLTLSGKGNINLLDRGNTQIIYTAKIANMSGKITDVRISGANATYFDTFVYGNGQFCIYANSDAPISAKQTYKLKVEVTLDNGYEGLSTEIKIKPVLKYPKLTASVKKVTLYKTAGEEFPFTVNMTPADMTLIESIEIAEDKNGSRDYFELNYDDNNNTCSIGITEKGIKNLTSGKTYNLTLNVHLYNDAPDAKPQTVKLAVTVW